LPRHGSSRLPAPEPAEKKQKCKHYPIGYRPVDLAEVHPEEGRGYLVVAIARTRTLAVAEWQPRATKRLAADFRRRVLTALPYKVHQVRTDNGTPFGHRPQHVYAGRPIFERVCAEHGSEPRFPTPAPPWPNGQVERFHRPRKEATVQRSHYPTTAQLNDPLQAFLLAYHHGKRLKRVRGKTAHEFLCQQGLLNPTSFTRDPSQFTRRLKQLVADLSLENQVVKQVLRKK
jgi:hypothetical protein